VFTLQTEQQKPNWETYKSIWETE